jgi:hypothetical protein
MRRQIRIARQQGITLTLTFTMQINNQTEKENPKQIEHDLSDIDIARNGSHIS